MARFEEYVNLLQAEFVRTDIPYFKAGDTINVYFKIREGDKERIQMFSGVVIQRRGHKPNEMVTVRKISGGVGVERIFPFNSPLIERIEVTKRGFVRRARIYYLRNLRGKAARIRSKEAVSVQA